MFRQILFALAVTIATFASLGEARADQALKPKSTTFSADLTGLWWNPNESGWGINIVQQSEIIFATLYVYGSNGQPLWLVGPNVAFSSADTSGAYLFSGPLYQTSGPFFGSSFNPSAVGATQVGTISLRFTSYDALQLTYSVGSTTVSKNLVPQTWRVNNLAGTYIGGMYGVAANCALPVLGIGTNLLTFTIGTSGTAVSMSLRNATGNSCNLSGTASQRGKLTNVDGTYSCTNGSNGQFAIRRLEAGIDGLSGAYFELSTGCTATVATIGAARVQ
ncbi:MAG TPA: hypothetical protein PLD37_03280 [Usitatibacteraceae bacterium]|nr:hypothetical protein [Usitatibacteraceae bacterium]